MQSEEELDGESAGDDVLKWDKMSGKGAGLEKDRMGDGGEEVSIGCSSSHTPIPEGSLHYVKGGEQVEHTKPLYAACDKQSCWAVRVHG